jgi:hypothetical protein
MLAKYFILTQDFLEEVTPVQYDTLFLKPDYRNGKMRISSH